MRELLVNVVKHANASSVTITVERHDPRIKVTAQDDGQGFDSAQIKTPRHWSGGFGLFNIRERLDHLGGRIEIESHPGSGTRVSLFAPLKSDRAPGKDTSS